MRATITLLLLLTACDGEIPAPDAAASTDAAVGTDAAAPPLPLPFYEVPTTNPALAPHAYFPVPDVHYFAVGGTVTLEYDFPEELSGIVDQTVTLSGPIEPDGSSTLSGAQGTGVCTVENGIVRCVETFTDLPLDPARAMMLAGSYSPDAEAQAARVDVIELFVSDPIGIVVFDRALANEPP